MCIYNNNTGGLPGLPSTHTPARLSKQVGHVNRSAAKDYALPFLKSLLVSSYSPGTPLKL
jgi:hypothetical protein